MNKIKYQRLGMAIEIKINEDYKVMGLMNRINGKNANDYEVTLMLRRDDIGKWDMLDNAIYKIVSDNICQEVASFIQNKFNSGFFDYYISRYEFELNMFDKGIELNDKEKTNEELNKAS